MADFSTPFRDFQGDNIHRQKMVRFVCEVWMLLGEFASEGRPLEGPQVIEPNSPLLELLQRAVDEAQAESLEELEDRRKKLLGLLLNDGWNWSDR